MSRIRACFLGTPAFAEVHLKSLLENPIFEVVGVVTQPDRPAGRKMQLTPSPVKSSALAAGLPVLTPENLRKEPEVFSQIREWKADVAVVVAFGQILSQEFLDSFKFGAVNVHGSLLPLWRGAAPIQRSIEAGDKVTGVSLQQMVKKLDAGPVIAERRVELSDTITATELYNRLAVLGCELINIDLPRFINGEIKPVIQDENLVTVAPKIEKEESLLNWNMPAREIHNRVRAFTMGPGTYVNFQGKRLKIHKTSVVEKNATLIAGQIAEIGANQLVIQTSENQISLLEVQPESKSRQNIEDFMKSMQASTPYKKGDSFV